MIKTLFQKWFSCRSIKPESTPTIFSAIQETNAALDRMIASQQRLFEAYALASKLDGMATFAKTNTFQSMAQHDKDALVAFLDDADVIASKLKKL